MIARVLDTSGAPTVTSAVRIPGLGNGEDCWSTFDGTTVAGTRRALSARSLITVDPVTGVENVLDSAWDLGGTTVIGPDVLYAASRGRDLVGGATLLRRPRSGGPTFRPPVGSIA